MTSTSSVKAGLLTSTAVVLALCLNIALLATSTFACTCTFDSQAPACHLISSTKVAFLGESVELVPNPRGRGEVYRFLIERVYKGIDPGIKEILVDADDGSCGTTYPLGYRYIIFASQASGSPQVVNSPLCSGSREADSHEKDVSWLDQWSRGATSTEVFGKVLQAGSPLFAEYLQLTTNQLDSNKDLQWMKSFGTPGKLETAPLKGAEVRLENNEKTYTTLSGADGAYRFDAIAPGRYHLSTRLEPYLPYASSVQIKVEEKSCQVGFLELMAGASLQGTLLKQDGSPASGVRLELLRRSENGKWHASGRMQMMTDQSGGFLFKELPSGDYLLGNGIWKGYDSDDSPYPTSYYPGVRDGSDAKTISLTPQQAIGGVKLQLPPQHHERIITIRIIGPNGQPWKYGRLEIETGNGYLTPPETVWTEGVVKFTGYRERSYRFLARKADLLELNVQGAIESEPVTVSPGKENIEITLILKNVLKDPRGK